MADAILELERLRKAVGLGPFQWDWWANLS